jgi:PAP2 superfamily
MARTVIADQSINLYETARVFALLNVAMQESWIAGWDSKFHYDFWRPITTIQQADLDGNPDTELDASWAPMRPTPGVADYISTHSALGEAAAVVLTEALGPTAFTMTSTTAVPAGSTRSFADFYAASVENAQSRVWVGVHFRRACEDGRAMGHEIGEIVTGLLPRTGD